MPNLNRPIQLYPKSVRAIKRIVKRGSKLSVISLQGPGRTHVLVPIHIAKGKARNISRLVADVAGLPWTTDGTLRGALNPYALTSRLGTALYNDPSALTLELVSS